MTRFKTCLENIQRRSGESTPELNRRKDDFKREQLAKKKSDKEQNRKAIKARKDAERRKTGGRGSIRGRFPQRKEGGPIGALAASTEVQGNAILEDLRKWVKQRWVDIGAPKKGGGFKPCGRSKGEKRKGYPKCVPAAKAASMSKGQRKSAVKRKRAAGNPGGKPTMVSTFKKKAKKREAFERLGQIIEGKLCPKGKAAAKRKFDVYPSAYANMYASAVCSGKTTPGGKKKKKRSDEAKGKHASNRDFAARRAGKKVDLKTARKAVKFQGVRDEKVAKGQIVSNDTGYRSDPDHK
tara:strand:+ start:138 stop:1022 length:885 start_codon:yes stop_codon:yes gene_type:complete